MPNKEVHEVGYSRHIKRWRQSENALERVTALFCCGSYSFLLSFSMFLLLFVMFSSSLYLMHELAAHERQRPFKNKLFASTSTLYPLQITLVKFHWVCCCCLIMRIHNKKASIARFEFSQGPNMDTESVETKKEKGLLTIFLSF
ncbi:hypothetical protein H5410_050231 [Solanum commersonii]|uniref:Uncharacterized protein n=1 Tax=Solanum commersonii TaxID=4109 RepID=A0A9J5WX00_SOLCO|nr:hypothetical protein H5410_050231 [Solanum commersonii]